MIAQLGYGSYPASIGSVPAPKDSLPPASMFVSAFVDPAQGIGGVYAVRYELVTAGASAYPGRTPRQMAPGDKMIV